MNRFRFLYFTFFACATLTSSVSVRADEAREMKVLPSNRTYADLIGRFVRSNGVNVQLRVRQVVSAEAPYVNERIIAVPASQLRPVAPSDSRIKVGKLARISDPSSGLYKIGGKVIARDGKRAVFSTERRAGQGTTEYVVFESQLAGTRANSLRPLVGEPVQINVDGHPLNHVQGKVVFQNGKEALVRYLSNLGVERENYFDNDKLVLLSARIYPDFSPEFLAQTFADLVTVSYGEKRVIFVRLAAQIDQVAPITEDFRSVSMAYLARSFVALAVRPVVEGIASEMETKEVIPVYREEMARLPYKALVDIPVAEPVYRAAALLLDAGVLALQDSVSGPDLQTAKELHREVGLYTAQVNGTRGAASAAPLLEAFREREPFMTRLEKNVTTQPVVMLLRSVLQYLEKRG